MDPKAAGSDTKNPCLCLCPPPPPPGATLSQGQKWSLGLSPDTCPGVLGAQQSVRQGCLGGFICLAPCAIRALPWAEHPPLAGGQPAPSRLQALCLPQAPS